MTKFFHKCAAALLAVVMLASTGTGIQLRAALPGSLMAYGTWFETAYAVWQGQGDSYYVFVQNTNQDAVYWRTGERINDPTWLNGWTLVNDSVNAPLVRQIDQVRNIWRADILGLPQGTYGIRISTDAAGENVVFSAEGLTTRAFPRYGAAFIPSNELISNQAANEWAPEGATGGYLSDGRVNPDAVIMYVSHNNWDNFTPENLSRENEFRGDNPMVIRFIGTVGDFERVADQASVAGAIVPPGVANAFNDAGAPTDQNRSITLASDSHGITFEGVGPDAVIYGWGFFTGGNTNVVFRNLSFEQYYAFGIRASGVSRNIWVHNNTLRYGQNWFAFNDHETDRAWARGVIDVEQNVTGYTISYNRFIRVDKTHLVVGGVQNWDIYNHGHQHYGTFHHNWYQGTQERNPRIRHHNIHTFNNLFEGITGHPLHYRLMDRFSGYAIGAGHNATIWAEGNIFENTGFPFQRSRMGHARGYYPHVGHNHFFGDGPGFMVANRFVDHVGDYVLGENGQPIEMYMPTSLAEFGIWSGESAGAPVSEVIRLESNANLANLTQIIRTLQPNVMDAVALQEFDVTIDVGVLVNRDDVLVTPPSGDQLYGVTATNTVTPSGGEPIEVVRSLGFPVLNQNAYVHGWAFDGGFVPSALDNTWATGSGAAIDSLRTEIETYSGVMYSPVLDGITLAAPIGVSAVHNDLEYFMHRQNSPMASFRVITHPNTFTINWDSNDALAEAYIIGFYRNGVWEEIGRVPDTGIPAMHRSHFPVADRTNTFVTQNVNALGNILVEDEDGNEVILFLGGEGHTLAFPREGFGVPPLTTADIPTELVWGDPWVLSDIPGAYVFGVRAVHGNTTSDWATTTVNISNDHGDILSVEQNNPIGANTAGIINFTVRTLGLPTGQYEISLSVPRSMARDTMPWPTAQNFSGSIYLYGAVDVLYGDDSPVQGNGGTGTISIANQAGQISIVLDDTVPGGVYDLVLTIEADGRSIAVPFTITVG